MNDTSTSSVTEQEKAAADEAEKIKAAAALEQECKIKYNAVAHIINIDENGVEHHLWLKEPPRMVVGFALATIDKNVTEACEYIFINAVIKEISDVAYFEKNEVFYGILNDLQRLVHVKKSLFKRL